jgi:hypothetical protein
MTDLLPELWERIVHLIQDPYKQRMYGVNRLFMALVFVDHYRHVELTEPARENVFLPSGRLRKMLIHIRYVVYRSIIDVLVES